MNRRALICGVSGQDGAYLAKLLLEKGYHVIGTSRDAQIASFDNLAVLGIKEHVETVSMALSDFRSVLSGFDVSKPDEVYNLAGQTSVSLSFDQPVEAMQSITTGTLNCLEAIRFLGVPIRMYNASSSECFGDTGGQSANEQTLFRPCSPYAVAKCAAHWLIRNYRDAYGIFACNGILFNHESNLRPERFVTQKIISAALRIRDGSKETLKLGRLDIARDWGWAPEYVLPMYRMLQKDKSDDYVIATGTTSTLEQFVTESFALLGLDWTNHVEQVPQFIRPTDILSGKADPGKANSELDWRAQNTMRDVVRRMINREY